jgi:hypothetical protein
LTTPYHFNRSKPFSPLVMNYVSQLIGFRELIAGGAIASVFSTLVGALDRTSALTKDEVVEIRQVFEKRMQPMKLKSEFRDDPVIIQVDEISIEISDNHMAILPTLLPAAGSILVVAYEIAKEGGWTDKGELWEFLRHCRNGIAHGGRFHFVRGEPSRAARWGAFEITRALQGVPVLKDGNGVGLLSPADPICLLWYIEQANPQMTVATAG